MASKQPIQSASQKPAKPALYNLLTSTNGIHSYKPNIWLAFISAIIGFCLYTNTINHEYVLDDVGAITGNEFVLEGISGIPKILKVGMWHFENLSLGYYRPISMITFAIENEFFPGNPHVSHLGNVMFYAFTGFCLCLLLMNIFHNFHPVFSFAVTLLFLAHPIHTEVVANIKSRDEMLAFLNLIIAFLFLLTAHKQQTNQRTVSRTNNILVCVACPFFYMALLSKESAIAGLFIAPLILFFSKNIRIKQAIIKTIPFALLLLIFQIHKYLALGTLTGEIPRDIVNYPYEEAGTKISSTFLIFTHYIRLILFPHPLSYDYSYNKIPSSGFSSPPVLAGLLIFFLLSYLGVKGLPKKSPLSLGIVIFCVTLMPALAFVFLKGGILAERFLYAPSLGFCILIVFLTQAILASSRRKDVEIKNPSLEEASLTGPQGLFRNGQGFLPAGQAGRLVLLFILFSLYSFKTFTRNTIWHDNMTLFSTDINTSRNSCQVQRHLGSVLVDSSASEKDSLKKIELFNKGIEHLRISLRINPHFNQTLFKIGYAYQNLKSNIDSAIFYYNRAIEESPSDAMSYNNLGSVYNGLGFQEIASYYFNKAVEVNPYFTLAARNRDNHRKKTGLDIHQFPAKLPPEIIEKIAKNKDALFYFKLGTNLTLNGDYIRGARYLEKAIEMDPKYEDSYLNLSTCYGMLEKYQENIDVLNKLLKINPNNARAYSLLAVTYEIQGDKEKAKLYTGMAKKLSRQ